MVLLHNSILKLDYTPATDIVEIAYPDLEGFLIPEIKHNIDTLVDIIRNYDIKNVCLDSSKTIVSVSAEESKQVTSYLAIGLTKTRVRKVARVQSTSSTVENTAQGNIKHINQILTLPYKLQNFTSKPDAIAWLIRLL